MLKINLYPIKSFLNHILLAFLSHKKVQCHNFSYSIKEIYENKKKNRIWASFRILDIPKSLFSSSFPSFLFHAHCRSRFNGWLGAINFLFLSTASFFPSSTLFSGMVKISNRESLWFNRTERETYRVRKWKNRRFFKNLMPHRKELFLNNL